VLLLRGRGADFGTSRRSSSSIGLCSAAPRHVQRRLSIERTRKPTLSSFPRYMDSHRRPMRTTQKATGLREISHQAFGRHSVASQPVTSGRSLRMVQAQLGHRSRQKSEKYSHLASRARDRHPISSHSRSPRRIRVQVQAAGKLVASPPKAGNTKPVSEGSAG
jgi:hypothetical protein